MRAHCLAAALLWLCSAACGQSEPRVFSFPYDPALATRLATDSPAWPAACARSPEERVGLPVALQLQSPQRRVERGLLLDLLHAVRGLRQPFAQLFQRHVCAVVLVHDAPMTGTLTLLDNDPSRGIILLNVDNLTPPDGDWLALKESTVFAPAPGRVLRGTMARADEQPRLVLLEYLLVHELAHVLDAVYFQDELIGSFKRLSWPRHDGLSQSPLLHYPIRLDKPPLPDKLLEPYYDLIASSAFATPAAVANAKEDFADSIATFMHTLQRGRPWHLEVYRNGRQVRQLSTCWEEARCAEKRQLIERLLKQWSRE